jgi:Fe-S-cluster containining protein
MRQNQIPSEFISDYKLLRDEIDAKCARLWNLHLSQMNCKEGCSQCCQAFKILPVEFHAIQSSLDGNEIAVNKNKKSDQCKFLNEKTCSIYENRPIICRTHGYPLIRLNEEAGAYEVSFCELNFIDYKLEKFNRNNVFYEDKYNSKLFMLNKRFIQHIPEKMYDSIQLIELNDIGVKTLI